ncbi:MAG: diaminopimelate decarboxylase [Thermomicrobiales bacterium]|nr:diaminopimelate decarboxylase [Thermomicrobiales bacterium]
MLWPETTSRNDAGSLTIGGVSLVDLAAEFGTPLYIFDTLTLQARAADVLAAVQAGGSNAEAVFASKALAIPAILKLLHDAGLGVDVASGGELHVALKSGIDPTAITFHGNNKSRDELAMALDAGIGLIAIDNLHEIDLLEELTDGRDVRQNVLIRVNPGIDVHTHGKIATGVIDSKFGFPLWTADADEAATRLVAIPSLRLVGYHCHLGSQLFDLDAPVIAVRKIMEFASDVYAEYGLAPEVISPGGGMGIAYTGTSGPVSMTDWVVRTIEEVQRLSAEEGFASPRVVFEPGRYLVGQAGVALYEVGSRKAIEGVRTYVSVDGGMADNIRPALYDAVYTAEIANRVGGEEREVVTISGKYCESGDVLIRDIDLPHLEAGDLLAVPASGAYCIPLASNYNMALRPAVVLVENGEARLVRRRESYDDLLTTSLLPG